jgi:hypothetical protein
MIVTGKQEACEAGISTVTVMSSRKCVAPGQALGRTREGCGF